MNTLPLMRAIGIVRVSEAKGRNGESFASPTEQRDRIQAACERDGFKLVATHDEIDVSGGTPLASRKGLLGAVESVEAGEADVLMVAYFDRLVRSLRVQDEVVSRIEAAGGRVLALDFGEVTGSTAAQWLSGTMIGAVSEYYRRSVKERSGEAQAMAVARGVAPWPNVPPGYARGASGILEPSQDAPVVAEGFAMRAGGSTIAIVRAFLADNGIERSYHAVQAMLGSRVYLGEIHFGKLVNLEAHPPIVERDVWRMVQGVRISRGRRAKSERLLARLGVLQCGSCGSRMVVGTAHHGRYALYRCPPTGDCKRRMTISAEIAEGVIMKAVARAIADEEGRASAERDAREALAVAERDQANLDAAIRAFASLGDEPVAIERLAELRRIRDASRDHAEHLGGLRSALTITVASEGDDTGDLESDRALVRAIVRRAVVGPGRGADRITIELVGEDAPGPGIEDAPDLSSGVSG